MNTRVTTDVAEAAAVLRDGGVAAVPTETVYGLAARIDDEQALRSIFAVKGRPVDNPLIVHVASTEQARQVAVLHNDAARRLADAFWPGPLTLVLPKQPHISDIVSAKLPTVAVRYPAHAVMLDLLCRVGVPIAAPSANVSGRPSPTTAQHCYDDLAGRIACILDGGRCDVGVESTIVDCTSNPPRLLRSGGLSLEQLRTIVPDLAADEPIVVQAPKAPGMKYRHYAPRVPLLLFDSLAALQAERRDGDGVLCFDSEAALLDGAVYAYGDENDADTLARKLFDGLRWLDSQDGVTRILARMPQPTGRGAAVVNRLKKAADKPLVIGLTGPIGSGKTRVAERWEQLDTNSINCDRIYHELLSGDIDLQQNIAARFGVGGADGIDRKALGRLVFGDAVALADLEALTHPAVLREVARRLEVAVRDTVVEAIALFESGADALCDVTVVVTADEPVRLKRVMARDGCDEATALVKMQMQKKSAYYEQRADYKLVNNGDEAALNRQATELLETIRRNRYGR